MKIAVIGANGRQGTHLCREACDRGHEVVAIIRDGLSNETRVGTVLHKNLFDLTRRDLAGCDAVISAFGSGFEADPAINREAIDRLISLLAGTGMALLIVGGSGCLYADAAHTTHIYELPSHPAFLREISRYMTMGLSDLKKTTDLLWTYVTPSLTFDYEGQPTGSYQIGTGEEPLKNAAGVSRITYADYAAAMLDEAERHTHLRQCITVCEV